jgi:PKD repeat protein
MSNILRKGLIYNIGLKIGIVAILTVLMSISTVTASDYFLYGDLDIGTTGGSYGPDGYRGSDGIDRVVFYNPTSPGTATAYIYKVTVPPGADPNMHPDNPYATGPIAPRTFTLDKSFELGVNPGHTSEFYVRNWKDSQTGEQHTDIYLGANPEIRKYAYDSTIGNYRFDSIIAPGSPIEPDGRPTQTLAYDPKNNVWYAGATSWNYDPGITIRKVWKYDASQGSNGQWVLAFDYTTAETTEKPHHDGMEYVGGYLYLADFHGDYIKQYTTSGSLIKTFYHPPLGHELEGMGYGALKHFWIGSNTVIEELGGGTLQAAIQGIPDQCILSGQTFATINLDNYAAGTRPLTWSYSGNTNLVVAIGTGNIVTVTYPSGWTGSETITFTVTDANGNIAKADSALTVDAAPNVGDIPDQTSPFAPISLDSYLSGIDASKVTWAATGAVNLVVNIDPATHVATITNSSGSQNQETITFTAMATCCNNPISDGDSATFAIDMPPVAEAGGPYTVDEGTSITIDATGSYDPSGSTLAYAWNFNNDNIYEIPGFSIVRTPPDGPRSRIIGLQVTNGQGRVATDTAMWNVNNVNPVVNAGQDQTINEGDTANFGASFSDVQPDMDASAAQINYGDGTIENVVANPNGAISGSHSYANSGTYTVTITVTDKDGGIGSDTSTVTVSSVPPIAEAGGPYTVDEGTSITIDATGSYDPSGSALTYAWDWNGDGIYEVPGFSLIRTPRDGPRTRTIGLQVTNGQGRVANDTAMLTINNVAPIIDSLSAEPYLAQVGTAITGTGTFHDPGTLDTFVAEWNWDDVTNTINLPNGSTSTTDSHTYTTPGVYSTSLQVTDKDGGSDIENMSQYIVVYDPDGGFVTGGGWINSPAEAYVANPTLVGRANFGFVSKYLRGATVPTGETEFQFKVADLNFHSTNYDWLVVAGARAQYKGSGTINGAGDYMFMLTAIDGQINGGGGADKFRIKIWEKATGTIVYDNQNGVTDDSNPSTAIAGGSIVIHK